MSVWPSTNALRRLYYGGELDSGERAYLLNAYANGVNAYDIIDIVVNGGPGGGGPPTGAAGGALTGSYPNPTLAANSVGSSQLVQATGPSVLGRTAGGAGNFTEVSWPSAKTALALVKDDVGLGNVDNTADSAKPVSSAQQTAIDAKVSDTVYGAGWNADTTHAPSKNAVYDKIETLGGGGPPTGAAGGSLSGTYPNPGIATGVTLTTPAISSPTGLVKADVGLGNVDNTSNATERAAVATLTNKTLTSPVVNTPTGIVKGDVGLGNVANVNVTPGNVRFIIDGGGSAITTGAKKVYVSMPYAGTITSWTILADQSGSIVIDVWKAAYASFPPVVGNSITASAKPTLTTATKATSSTLTGWTTSVSAGDVLEVNVDSVTTVTKVTLDLAVTKT